jgi:hypothetical protein
MQFTRIDAPLWRNNECTRETCRKPPTVTVVKCPRAAVRVKTRGGDIRRKRESIVM